MSVATDPVCAIPSSESRCWGHDRSMLAPSACCQQTGYPPTPRPMSPWECMHIGSNAHTSTILLFSIDYSDQYMSIISGWLSRAARSFETGNGFDPSRMNSWTIPGPAAMLGLLRWSRPALHASMLLSHGSLRHELLLPLACLVHLSSVHARVRTA